MSKESKIQERNLGIEKFKVNFKEINNGYTYNEMLEEAKRCKQCINPQCVKGCPVNINIPKFIHKLTKNNIYQAMKIIKSKNTLPSICGRVCPQENQCEKYCILSKNKNSICIGNLERYVADNANDEFNSTKLIAKKNKIKVAIIGSGPSGLTCAGDLLKIGYDVTIYESLHVAGGVLRYGIPEFRLPKKILDIEINNLKKNGLKIVLNNFIGRTQTIKDLLDCNFKAIFIGTGSGIPKFPGIEGENLKNIYCANEFLVRTNLMYAYNFPNVDTPIYIGQNVAVIGGGNTALDSARTAIRLGAKQVKIIYRREEINMPVRKLELIYAKKEGVQIISLTNPLKFIGNNENKVISIECIKMENNKKNLLKKIKDSNHIIKSDMVILALGSMPNHTIALLTKGLKINRKNGYLVVDNNLMTSIPGIFAGGDIVGGSTVIEAMYMGKKAAVSIVNYLKNY
ncbi:MAG: NADPH-dependent glutamate synthase [Endomicrobium sp.]|jgi:glutamate synthase (NADPH/NADH) small chain|nr:NADPH-dependent glutamate synthase [Endomicrobium sp.]